MPASSATCRIIVRNSLGMPSREFLETLPLQLEMEGEGRQPTAFVGHPIDLAAFLGALQIFVDLGLPVVAVEYEQDLAELPAAEAGPGNSYSRKSPAEAGSRRAVKGETTMFDLPLEYVLIRFEDAHVTGTIVPELLDLAQRGIVRFIDIVFIRKGEDGATQTIELSNLEPVLYEMFVPIGEHVSGLFTNDDLEIAARKLGNNSAAVLFLWENLWVANLRRAIVDAGGQLVERGQIAPEIIEQYEQAFATE